MTSRASARPAHRDGPYAFAPAAAPYDVSRVKIAEFADAIDRTGAADAPVSTVRTTLPVRGGRPGR